MDKNRYKKIFAAHWVIIFLIITGLVGTPEISSAFFEEDMENPKPEFTQEGAIITARLIPRGKSTSVLIDFEVSGGKLVSVSGKDFRSAARPEVDNKNFKSELFIVQIEDVSPVGSKVTVKTSSTFYTGSTKYYVFNETQEKPWMIPDIRNIAFPNFLQKLEIDVKDGGQYDSDGAVNGKITFIGGPRDSFWGYALGTLFIRFFGIFLVLSFLMAGMMISGKIFKMAGKRAEKAAALSEKPEATSEMPELKPTGRDITPEMATAIGMALHLHFSAASSPLQTAVFSAPALSTWAQHGRQQLMSGRMKVFNRE